MKVPLLDLQAQYASIREDVLAAITRVCDTLQFILGPEVERLERELAAAIGVRHAVAVSSGTDALLATMMALDIGPGDEVITPTFSFLPPGTAWRASARGACSSTSMRPRSRSTPTACAPPSRRARKRIVPVHFFGLCADMDPLAEAAGDIPLIEDAAAFSFYPSKSLGAYGDAGLVTTDADALGRRVRRLRTHGAEPKYYHREIGGNFRIDALQAAVLTVKLPRLPAWNARRRANAARYQALFARFGLCGRVTLPAEPDGRTHVYHQYVIRVPGRDAVRRHLGDRGVGADVYYPVPFHRQECFREYVRPADVFPNADAGAAEVLALPIYPELTEEQQEHVVRSIAEALG